MNKDSYKQIKKVADFEANCRYFDSLLADLQEEYKDQILDDYQSLRIYSSAGMVRDTLYILLQRMRGVPSDEIYQGMI